MARTGIELRDALAQGHAGHALARYAAVFFGLWRAWVNFTWFASAYDTDDVPCRLLASYSKVSLTRWARDRAS